MKSFALQQIALHKDLLCRDLPFELGRQARACPSGKGIGLVVADVADRLRLTNLAHPGAGELQPVISIFFPIERRRPPVRLYRLPAVGKPEFGTLVTAIVDERQILAASSRP